MLDCEIFLWLVRLSLAGVITGSANFATQSLLKRAQTKLEDLRSQPLNPRDQDLEELLTHFIDEMGSLDPKDLSYSRMLKFQFELSKAYIVMHARKLVNADKSRPGGA